MTAGFDEFRRIMDMFPRMGETTSARAWELYGDFLSAEKDLLAEPMDYFKYHFDAHADDAWRTSFMTRLQYASLCDEVNDPESCSVVRDKVAFSGAYAWFLGRRVCVARPRDRESFDRLVEGHDRVFIKPMAGGYGRGAHYADASDPEALWASCLEGGCLVEEPIVQHATLAAPHPSSVNCVRLVTALDPEGAVRIVSAALRCGEAGSDTDSGGGLAAPVDIEYGRVCGPGVTHFGEVHETHADTGVRFEGIELPSWGDLVESVCEATVLLPGLRLMNWDWACREDGTWVVVEGNVHGGLGACQQAHGRGCADRIRTSLGLGA